jgi:acyl-CoA hydrolase
MSVVFGGQVDFIQGASIASDETEKPIITLQSETKKGDSMTVLYLK